MRRKGKVIIVGATKGGVGKSVSTYNLAYSLASMGKRVLAVDFDSQANLSTCFGIEDTAAVPLRSPGSVLLQFCKAYRKYPHNADKKWNG